MEELLKNIECSLTPFHAVKRAEEILGSRGFTYLSEKDEWRIVKGGKYYVTRNESSLIAFCAGERFIFNVAASHTDSPCLKIKGNPQMEKGKCCILNAEVYGAPILNTFLDRKLALAGRAFYDSGESDAKGGTSKHTDNGAGTCGEKIGEAQGGIECRLINTPFNVVIPNVALHLNREVNNGVKINAQVDMCPIYSLGGGDFEQFLGDPLSYELFAVCDEKGYLWGRNNEFFASPRLDDLAGVFASLKAFTESKGDAINMLAIFDNEEIGSRTRQGAASTFLRDVMERIAYAYNKNGEQLKQAMAMSMMLSVDNAQASHPNHLEHDDPTSKTVLGGGLAIKHNAKFNYTTDAFSAARLRKLFNNAGVKYQDYYVKSDLNGGSTLGIVSSAPVSIPSADIGLPQLGMHSAVESASVSDYHEFVKGIKAFYNKF